MKKPQVLVLIDWYKPFFKAGGPVRSLVNMVDHLHDKVDFHIVTGDRDYMDANSPKGMQRDGWVKGDRGEMIWFASPEKRSIRNWRELLMSEKWDVIYLNGLYSKWSTIIPLWILRGSTKRRIVAVRGMLAAGPMQQGALKKRLFLLAMKLINAFRGVEFQATNAEEVNDIKKWIGKDTKVYMVPNLPRKMNAMGPVPIQKNVGELDLISPARIAEEKGTLFAIERLKNVTGKIRFHLHGTVYDEAYLAQCHTAISQLPSNIKVELKGQLKEDEVMDRIARAHVLFMPSTGENFGHAMLEALSIGRPLLISDRTPWKKLGEKNAGWDLPLETPERFTEVLQQLVHMDNTTFQQWCNGAFDLGSSYMRDPSAVEKSLAMLKGSVASSTSA